MWLTCAYLKVYNELCHCLPILKSLAWIFQVRRLQSVFFSLFRYGLLLTLWCLSIFKLSKLLFLIKPQPNTCCSRLATLFCDMLGAVGSNLTIFKLEPTTLNMSQHDGQTRAQQCVVTGSNPVEALIFFRLLLSNCLSWKINCDDHPSLSSRDHIADSE